MVVRNNLLIGRFFYHRVPIHAHAHARTRTLKENMFQRSFIIIFCCWGRLGKSERNIKFSFFSPVNGISNRGVRRKGKKKIQRKFHQYPIYNLTIIKILIFWYKSWIFFSENSLKKNVVIELNSGEKNFGKILPGANLMLVLVLWKLFF